MNCGGPGLVPSASNIESLSDDSYQIEYGRGSLGKFIWMLVVSTLQGESTSNKTTFSRLIRLTNKPLASPNGVDMKENAIFEASYCDFINGKIVHTRLQSDDNAIHVTATDPKAEFKEF